jgi:hypothetical protein
MLETLYALVLAHALADFVFQTRWMVANKAHVPVLGLHVAIVTVLSIAALGGLPWGVLAVIAGSHLVMDVAKTHWLRDDWRMFLFDQAVHLGAILATALTWPMAYSAGIWAVPPSVLATLVPAAFFTGLPDLMLIVTGLILTTRMGDYLIGKIMKPIAATLPDDDRDSGLPEGGRLIGLLERALIYLLVLTGQGAGVGFLIAAKSILRFNTTKYDRKMTEYVIIGTLLSFGWAMLIGWAVVAMQSGA